MSIPDSSLPSTVNEKLTELVQPHIQSYNYFLGDGMRLIVENLDKVEYEYQGHTLTWWIEEVNFSFPCRPGSSDDDKVFPHECREARITYGASMYARICMEDSRKQVQTVTKKIGLLPIMVKSSRCRLAGLSPSELVKHGEEPHELGGYFIVNGNEKIVRMLVAPRRNDVTALVRPSFAKLGPGYTQYACAIRSVRRDQTAQSVTMHYISDGSVSVRLILNRQEFFIPLVVLLKALGESTDRAIYSRLCAAEPSHTQLSEAVELLLRQAQQLDLPTPDACRVYLGSRFRAALKGAVSDRHSDADCARMLLDRHMLVHLDSASDKASLLVWMLRKLLAVVWSECAPDNADQPANHEVLTAGHLMGLVLGEQLRQALQSVRSQLARDVQLGKGGLGADGGAVDVNLLRKYVERRLPDVGAKLANFLSTGNLVSESGLDLMQTTGFTVLAEKLNFLRYVSHFRCIHRGAFFAEMKTTTVRKLLPEAWGFLCPVHTPDGAPCGLLNHLAAPCRVVADRPATDALPSVLASLGMSPAAPGLVPPGAHLTVMLDGRIVGSVAPSLASGLVARLRALKVSGERDVPPTLELAYVPASSGGRYPGIFLFSTPFRFMRPVRSLLLPSTDMQDTQAAAVEWIGSLEQEQLHVALSDADVVPGLTQHVELAATHMLSMVASLTPFSEFNQSPRNMYQCQMAKQTMGTPCHSYVHRTDNKLYRIQHPQRPLVRTRNQLAYAANDYPHGCNAVVAVLSYTGYDMEDAMIIKKSAYERGFGHATVYKTVPVMLAEPGLRSRSKSQHRVYFHNLKPGRPGEPPKRHCLALDDDGLPMPGTRLEKDTPEYCVYDELTGQFSITKYKGTEPCHVDEVRILGGVEGDSSRYIQNISIKLRYNRNPVIGDKFSSRHGQKGVLSHLWPERDLPFSEQGITPDVIINPHAFPSRMTIGMLVESLAGKSGSLHAVDHDATPFQFGEAQTAADHFGRQLVQAGFAHSGTDTLYSGVTGMPLSAEIYQGVVYYQRLRHMVKDKYQVRSTGPINQLTRQPIKGRKVGGGIRFGEMERDSLLAHGVSFILHDRLMNCSDTSKALVCAQCGSLLAPITLKRSRYVLGAESRSSAAACRWCESGARLEVVHLPYVFRYLAVELASLGIKVSLTVS
eukprot:TRINITY_DN4314_c0_g1_i2.p1 TRINITY_DN4314_c0_g1~~TRINITY_DN4314_c0_g1_i2.p1  ORF type:complete len:1147 (+),score=392.00 TRINITY_DN4314_c0_g1_i2:142-3582(+)